MLRATVLTNIESKHKQENTEINKIYTVKHFSVWIKTTSFFNRTYRDMHGIPQVLLYRQQLMSLIQTEKTSLIQTEKTSLIQTEKTSLIQTEKNLFN